MATNRTVTVKSTGGDYTSLNAALSAEADNLVSLDRQLTIECYNFEDTTAVDTTGQGWTTDATRYVEIVAAVNHNGKWSTAAYRLSVTDSNVFLNPTVDHLYLTGLQFRQIRSASNGGLQGTLHFDGGLDVGVQQVDKCIIVLEDAASYTAHGIRVEDSSPTYNFRNTVIYGGSANSSSSGIFVNAGTAVVNCDNVTIDDCSDGIKFNTSNTTGVKLQNTRITACTTVIDEGTGSIISGSNYNLTDGTAPTNWGANSLDSTDTPTIDYVDDTNATLTSRDYHLNSASDSGDSAGTDLSGTFTTDIDGETRSKWSIGADDGVSSTSTVTPQDATHAHTADNATVSVVNAPTGLSAVSASLTSIALSWTDTNASAKAYRVYVDGALNDQTAVGDTSYTVEWLDEGSYTIGVSAFDAVDESPQATTTGWTVVTLLTAEALHAHTADNTTVTTTSTSVSPADATHAHTADNATVTVTTVSVTVQDATHAHTADDATVYDESAFSAPTDLALTVAFDQITATWTDTNSGSFPYRIWYKRDSIDSSYTLDSTTATGAESAVVKYLAPNTLYWIYVAPYDNPNNGPGVQGSATTGSVLIFSALA